MLTSLAFVSLCFLYGISNVKGVFLLRCDPPLLSRFSCCLLTALSSVEDIWVPSPTQTPLDFLKERAALSEVNLNWEVDPSLYQKAQDENVTQQENQLTWWLHTVQVLKANIAKTASPSFCLPATESIPSFWHLGFFCLLPPLRCHLRVTVADLEGSVGF